MEEKMDAMLEMVKSMTMEIGGLKSEVGEFKSEMNDFRSEVNHRFDLVDERFDGVEVKIDNLSTESRSYFKCLEDRTDTHEAVLQRLSYKANVHDGQIAEVQEKMKVFINRETSPLSNLHFIGGFFVL